MKTSLQISGVWNMIRTTFRCLSFLILIMTTFAGFAQQSSDIEKGVIRIKLKEDVADQLQYSKMRKSLSNHVLTGIRSLDQANEKQKVLGMKRVFRDAGKFEAKHRKYGLHLWYEVELDSTTSVLDAKSAFSSLEFVEQVDLIHKKKIFEPESTAVEKIDDANKEKSLALTEAPNDPHFKYLWAFSNTGQYGGTPGADINLLNAWTLETGNSDVVVAVIDGGIDIQHPDLVSNLWINTNEIPNNGIDDDDNGFIDDVNGYGFGDNSNVIYPEYHGTHVAGTIAATSNNGIGVSGIAGGSGNGDGARLMSCAVFGASHTGNFDDAFIYAADNGAVIAQNSWAYTRPNVYDYTILLAIDYFIAEAGKDEFGNQVGPMNGGIVFFGAANNNSNANYYPAYYSPTVAVAAVNNLDKKAYYSNYGSWVDVAAPGGESLALFDRRSILSTGTNGTYLYLQGTSMACPHASGVAALVVSKYKGPGLSPATVRGRLLESADNIDSVNADYVGQLGAGRLNAFGALLETDGIPPNAITDLEVYDATTTTVSFLWTAPGENGRGQATKYDIRYSTTPITVENFDSASVVFNTLKPLPIGSKEFFRVTKLAPATEFYFAIKSIDAYGNPSLISNIISHTTDIPPDIFLSPASLQVDMVTAEKVTRTITITNSGEGKLDFSFIANSYGMVLPSSWSGTVAPGENLDMEIEISARRLLPGTYYPEFKIVSNDPVKDIITIPIAVNVTPNGFPIAELFGIDSLNFGDMYIGGTQWGEWTSISNEGSEPLFISIITSSNPLFVSDWSLHYGGNPADTITVAPFEEVTLLTTFHPVALGPQTGEVFIETNDPNKPLIIFHATGNGIKSPKDLLVFPTSIYGDTVYVNEKYEFKFRLKNDGIEDVEFWLDEYEWEPLKYFPSSGMLSPGDSIEVKGVYDTRYLEPGYAYTYISLNTDDPKYMNSYGWVYMPLTVFLLPNEVNDFNVTRFKSGVIESTFSDTTVFDIADPNIEKYTIEANTSPEKVGSVSFTLDGVETNIDNSAPYIINHWLLPVLSEGYHVLTAQAFTESYGQGFAGQVRTVIIHVINSSVVTSFDLINSDGAKLMELQDGAVIDISQPNLSELNIFANTNIGTVRSVKFILNDITARIDNGAPYALKGNPITGDTFWKPKPGYYSLTAVPYMKYFGWGPKGTSLTIHFQIVNGVKPAATIARVETDSQIQGREEEVDPEKKLSVYPVPAVDELHMELHESVKGKVVLNIMSAQGKSIHTKEGEADEFRKYSVSTEQLGMSSGIYFMMVTQTNGKRIVKKFIKE